MKTEVGPAAGLLDMLKPLVDSLAPLHFIFIGVLILLAISAIVGVLRWRQINVREVNRAVTKMVDAQGDASAEPRSELVQALARNQFLVMKDGVRVVERESTEVLSDFLAKRKKQASSFVFGQLILPLSLMLTFTFIALAIPKIAMSIQELNHAGALSGGSTTPIEQFAGALTDIGAKFVFSVLGISLSAAFGFISHLLEKSTYGAIDGLMKQARDGGYSEVTLASYEKRRSLELLGSVVNKAEDQRVLIQEFASSVVMDLKNVMDQSVGDRIRELLDEQRRSTDHLVEKFTSAFTEEFSRSLGAMTSEMSQKLESISEKISSKGENQFVEILSKLESVISGGMKSESKALGDAISTLSVTIPKMETAFVGISHTLSELHSKSREGTDSMVSQLLERTEQQAKVTENVLAKMVSAQNEILEATQSRSAQAIGAFRQNSEESLRLVSEAVSKMALETRNNSHSTLSEVSKTLKPLIEEVAGIASRVSETSSLLDRATRSFSEREQAITSTLRSLTSASESVALLVADAKSLGQALGGSMKTTKEVLGSLPHEVSQLHDAMVKQRSIIQQQSQEWEAFSENIEASLSAGVARLAEKYKDLASDASAFCRESMNLKLEPVNTLSQTIEDLIDALRTHRLSA